jgi:hypothetical protein
MLTIKTKSKRPDRVWLFFTRMIFAVEVAYLAELLAIINADLRKSSDRTDAKQ